MTLDAAVHTRLARAAADGEATVLATVVRVVGSAYLGVGTRMVVGADGRTTGLVSGGCLEGDLAARAAAVAASGRAALVTYDTRSGDDLVWGLGLGCEGLVEVLLEPLAPEDASHLVTLLERARGGERCAVLATLFDAGTGEIAAVGARIAVIDGDVVADVQERWSDPLLDRVVADAREIAGAATVDVRGTMREYDDARVAFEIVAPPVRLLLFGTGPDVAPVARLASQLGWEVTVVDHRATPASAGRFPGARVVPCPDPSRLGELARLGPRTHAVVMSHHFERDLAWLHALLASEAPYVGMLGPRARTERLLAEHAARFGPVTPAMRDRVHGPVGLDLGGDGPDAVALAIVAEVQAVASGRAGGHLREREAPIHDAGSGARVAGRG